MKLLREKKNAIREQTLKMLRQLSKQERMDIEAKLTRQLFQSELWINAKVLGITFSTDIEWDTEPIIKRAWQEQKIVAIPKTNPRHATMDFYEIFSHSTLHKGFGGILEPEANEKFKVTKNKIDLLVVPGVVFNQCGYRIGFGGGYYDRFLVDFKGTTVSLVSAIQLVNSIPIEEHDINVQFIITEHNLLHTERER